MSGLWKKLMLLFFLCFFFAFCFFVWARFIEPNLLKLEKISFDVENLAVSNLTILHLTDLHSKSFGKNEKDVLNAAKEINPDFIFLTGDIIDWQTKDWDACFSFWQELVQDREGRVFAVYGNHEHRNPEFKKIGQLFKKSGMIVLENENVEIEIGVGSFYLIGVDDPHLGFDDLDKAMIGVKQDHFQILLAHSPEIFRKAKETSLNLVLVGHTHGCQINLPILCDCVIPLEYDKQYKQGLFYENDTYLYVNRGIGETFLPLRFNSVPEALVITINPDN